MYFSNKQMIVISYKEDIDLLFIPPQHCGLLFLLMK
jgi:hypothetical protein